MTWPLLTIDLNLRQDDVFIDDDGDDVYAAPAKSRPRKRQSVMDNDDADDIFIHRRRRRMVIENDENERTDIDTDRINDSGSDSDVDNDDDYGDDCIDNDIFMQIDDDDDDMYVLEMTESDYRRIPYSLPTPTLEEKQCIDEDTVLLARKEVYP